MEVVLDQPAAAIARATLTATANGVYEAFINGVAVTASVLNPGRTAYEWRLAVQTFDVADLLANSGPSPMANPRETNPEPAPQQRADRLDGLE